MQQSADVCKQKSPALEAVRVAMTTLTSLELERDQDKTMINPGEDDWKEPSEKDSLITKKPREDSSTGVRGNVIILAVISALGGFLFGYDTGVVSGAMLPIRKTFSLDSTMVELIVSVTIAAAAVSAFVAGFLCNLIGRKPTLIIASLIFTAGAAVMGASYYPWMLLLGRGIVGVGIGMAAMAVPMYIAESAPAGVRGKLVVMNVLFITGGQCVATIVDGAFSYLRYDIGWRFMLALAGVPSLLMFVGMMFVPETPRWLVFHGKKERAKQVLAQLHHPSNKWKEYQIILADYEEHTKIKLSAGDLVKKFFSSKAVLLALLVGCGLQFFQQFGGINTVMYYSASIIQMAGFSDQRSIWLATIPGGANFLFTIVGLLLVDRVGRRKLLISSMSGVIFSFVLLAVTFVLMDKFSPAGRPYPTSTSCQYSSCGACVGNSGCGFCVDYNNVSGDSYNGTCSPIQQYNNGTTSSKYAIDIDTCAVSGENIFNNSVLFEGYRNDSMLERRWLEHSCPGNKLAPLAIISLFLYIAFFAPGMGPLPWTVNSEIYPTWARSTAISIATMVNWMCNLVVSMTFLTLTDSLGQSITFGLYAGFSVLGLMFIILFVPETKGLGLEDVEKLFKLPYFLQWCSR